MKVALCVSGLMRTYRQVGQSLIDNIIIPNKADLFISTWDILGTGAYKTPGRPWEDISGEESPISEEEISSFYGDHLKKINVEDWGLQKRFKEEIDDAQKKAKIRLPRLSVNENHNKVMKRIFSMHYKVNDANRLRKNYEEEKGFQYDVVIRGRPDLKHEQVLSVKDYDVSFPKIYTDIEHNYGDVCDQFAFGSSKVMDLYSNIYPELIKYKSDGLGAYNAERLMRFHLESINKLKVIQIKVGFKNVGIVER